MRGLIGQKLGMTQFWREDGRVIPVTVIQGGPCVITQIKTEERDGYSSVQLGYKDKKESRATKAAIGHFQKANTSPKYLVHEFRDMNVGDKKEGDALDVDLFTVGDLVTVSGTSKGRGFTGVMKRHNFSGGRASHGKSDQLRAGGSIGASSDPSRVFPGQKMAGRSGGKKSSVRNLEIVAVDVANHIVMVKGAVPGPNKGFVQLLDRG
ncbi:MAG: 50S ribosomal protein L3 [Candidatus Marinimicrobia bacterium]|nr:50S ribosomal protein L3 [Candidatus Neomarinimicrobiota bacterium]